MCLVARVLSTPFALGYPDVLALFLDDVVHVAAHKQAALVEFVPGDVAPDNEGLVQPYQGAYPRINEEIVPDGYLAGGRELGVVEHHIEDGRVEHYVAVVREKGVAWLAGLDGLMVERVVRRAIPKDVVYHRLHEPQLELEGGVDAPRGQLQHAPAHAQRKYGGDASEYARELAVVEQALDGRPDLLVVVRPNGIKFIIHNS